MSEPIKKTLTVRQLTAGEAAEFLDSIREGIRVHAIDILMDGSEIPSALVFAATGTTYETFPLDIPPDDLPALYEEVGRLNPFMVKAAKRQIDRQIEALDKVAAEIEELERRQRETKSGASASSSP